jgi:hypothetical protein
MQKKAWTYTMAGTVCGAVAVIFRWLQVQTVFDEETGLPTLHAPLTTMLVVVLIAVAALLWWLSGRMHADWSPEEPEDAFALAHRETGWLLVAAAAVTAFGSVYLFFTEDDTLMKTAALLGLLSAPVLAVMPQLPKWGGFGAALSVIPVIFYSLWLVVYYKNNAANPILWSYGMEILAIAMCLLAAFRLSAYLFYRAKPRKAIFACMLALTASLATFTDSASIGLRAVVGGWGIGCAVMCWVLIRNFTPPEPEEEEY